MLVPQSESLSLPTVGHLWLHILQLATKPEDGGAWIVVLLENIVPYDLVEF